MITISAFRWVPPFAQGQVRDLRVRWALEEAGLPYRTRLLEQGDQDKPDYRALQPFGQVPILEEDGRVLFESGAIVLHIGERTENLLPKDAGAQLGPRPVPGALLRAQPAASRTRTHTASAASPIVRARSEDAVRIEHRPVHAHPLHRRPRAGAHQHRAAGAAADRARHELLQRHLTRHAMPARQLRAGLEHPRRPAREDLDLAKLRGAEG